MGKFLVLENMMQKNMLEVIYHSYIYSEVYCFS